MKYSILSDVHSNWEALTAVIEDALCRLAGKAGCAVGFGKVNCR